MSKTIRFSILLICVIVLSYFGLSYLRLIKNQTAPSMPTVSESRQLNSELNSLEPLLRGEIDHYDQNQQTLYLQTAEQLIAYPLAIDAELVCWPTWQNGVQIREAYIPLRAGQAIYITGEKATTLNQLNLSKLTGKYIFLQQDQNRQLVKVALVNCYE